MPKEIKLKKALAEDPNIKSIVVDKDTGEVVETLGPGDRITKAKTIAKRRNINRTVEYEDIPFDHFKKLNQEECTAIIRDLTITEMAVLFVCALYTSYEDQMLRYPNGVPLTQAHIAKVSGIGTRAVSDAMVGLQTKGLVIKHHCMGKRGYQLNPWVAVTGSRIEKDMCEKFRQYEVKSKGVRPWAEVMGEEG